MRLEWTSSYWTFILTNFDVIPWIQLLCLGSKLAYFFNVNLKYFIKSDDFFDTVQIINFIITCIVMTIRMHHYWHDKTAASFIDNISNKTTRSTTSWRREAWKPKQCNNIHSRWSTPNNWHEPSRTTFCLLSYKLIIFYHYIIKLVHFNVLKSILFDRIITWKKLWKWETFSKNFFGAKEGVLLQYLA